MTPQIHPRRKRGAQPGNTNALKHGFYTTRLPFLDRADLENYPFEGAAEEAQILRLYIRRVVELTAASPNLTLDQAVHLLRVLSLSITSLSHILRTDQILFRGAVTDHDRAFARRRALILAREDALRDAELQAELEAGQEPLQTAPLEETSPIDDDAYRRAVRKDPTFDEAMHLLDQILLLTPSPCPQLSGGENDGRADP